MVVEAAVDRKFVTGTIGMSLRSPSRGGTGAALPGVWRTASREGRPRWGWGVRRSAGVRRRGLAGCGEIRERPRNAGRVAVGLAVDPTRPKRASREHANDDDQQGSEQHGERTGIHGPESDRGRRNRDREGGYPRPASHSRASRADRAARDRAPRMPPSLIWSNSKPTRALRAPIQGAPEHRIDVESASIRARTMPCGLRSSGVKPAGNIGPPTKRGTMREPHTQAAHAGRRRRPYTTNRACDRGVWTPHTHGGGQTR